MFTDFTEYCTDPRWSMVTIDHCCYINSAESFLSLAAVLELRLILFYGFFNCIISTVEPAGVVRKIPFSLGSFQESILLECAFVPVNQHLTK